MSRWVWMMVGVAVIWGAAFPFTKPALAQMTPATFTALRFLLVSLILTPIALLDRWRATGRVGLGLVWQDWPRLIAAGLIGYVVTQISQNWALSLSPSSDIALIASTQAVWIVAFGALFLGEAVARRGWLGLVCCLGGVLLITGVNPFQLGGAAGTAGAGWQRPVGDLIFLGGSACWAVYNLLNRPLGARNPPISTMAAMSLVGLTGLTPFALAEQIGWLRLPGVAAPAQIHLTRTVIGGLVYSAVFVTVIGLLALLIAYRHLRVAQVAVTFYVSPLTGVLVSVIWLGESLHSGLLLGMPLILLGLYLATSAARPAGAAAPGRGEVAVAEG